MNPDQLTNVYIQPEISRNWNQLQSREYQKVEVPPSSSSKVYLDTTYLLGEKDPTDVLVSSVTSSGNTPNVLFKNVSKVAVESIYLPTGQLDNVTSRNNQILFETTNDPGVIYEAIIPVGKYETITRLMDEIETQMNIVEVTGIYTWNNTNNRFFTQLVSGSGNFRILPESTMVQKGSPLINLPSNNQTTGVKNVGPINLLQTKFIEIFSQTLARFNRIPSISNSYSNTNVLARVFLNEPGAQRSYNEEWLKFKHLNYFYIRPDQSVSSIDFQLRDQFGDYLQIRENPDLENPKKDSFNWQITLVVTH